MHLPVRRSESHGHRLGRVTAVAGAEGVLGDAAHCGERVLVQNTPGEQLERTTMTTESYKYDNLLHRLSPRSDFGRGPGGRRTHAWPSAMQRALATFSILVTESESLHIA